MSTLKTGALRGTSGTADSVQLHASNQSVTFPGAVTIAGALTSSTTSLGGVKVADSWVVTSNLTVSSSTDVTSNWAQHSASNAVLGTIGSAMTQSSGIFTFPETGIYQVTASAGGKASGGARTFAGCRQYVSSDSGSNWVHVSSDYSHGYDADAHFAVSGTVLIDVTNASTFRWKLNVEPSSTSIFFGGGSSNKTMGAVFIKLGET